MFCLYCDGEIKEEETYCPHCGKHIVHFGKETAFVKVYDPINSQEVAMIRMIMEREGIPYHIKNDRLHGAVLFAITGPGSMELWVPEKFTDEVKRLLSDELGHG